MKSSDKISQKKNSFQKIKKLVTRQRVQSVFTLALALLLFFQIFQYRQLSEKVDSMESLKESNTTVLQEVSQGKDYLTSFASDLNEIRKFLLLPTRSYDFSSEEEVNLAAESEEEDLNTLLFGYVERLGEYEQNQKLYNDNLSTIQTALVDSFWSENGLSVDTAGNPSDESMDFAFLDATGGEEVFTISLGFNGKFEVATFDSKLELSDASSTDSVVGEVKKYVADELPGVREHLKLVDQSRSDLSTALGSSGVKDVLASLSLKLGTELQSPDVYQYPVLNKDNETVAEFFVSKEDAVMGLSLEITFDGLDSEYTFGAEDAESVISKAFTEALDTRTEVQKLVEKNKADVESAFTDKSFQSVLSQMGLTFGAAEETDTRISYPIKNAAGETLRVLFIDKGTGEVKVENSDGQNSQTLSMAVQEFDWLGKKKLSTQSLA